jgi:hypothetical protein
MIENLSQYWDKADGKTKKKIISKNVNQTTTIFNILNSHQIRNPPKWRVFLPHQWTQSKSLQIH